ncbi:MAG TPA: aminotransferase class I/II-fold pyridoxal phosphate-dependent enzyme [Bacteroidales bacterium]|nr:aminotransferase class I/II-fold pyridoxal phosphate-dependent enzyme [Bacteroidales bacterium]
MLIGHGDDIPNNLAANFSSNVWYGANNDSLYAYLASHLKHTRNYPEVLPTHLTNCIADYHKVKPENILVTNGATEAIYLIAHTFSKYVTSIVCPAFSEYEDACNLYKHNLNFISESELKGIQTSQNEMVVIGNPNNPTGTSYSFDFIEKLLQNNPNTIFVIDEAYADFTTTETSAIGSITKHANLIITRSLTKKFCIPGLRLGYIVADSLQISKIKAYKMPWSINTLAIEAGEYLISRTEEYQIPLREWLSETLRLMNEIRKLNAFNVFPSQTSYFLCETQRSSAAQLKQYLLKEHALLIRDASNFRGLSPKHFRICAQSRDENELLINALKQWTLLF